MSSMFVPWGLPKRIIHVTRGQALAPGWRQAMDGYWFFDLQPHRALARVRIQAYRDGHVNVADVDRLGRCTNWERYESLALALRFYGWRIP